MSDEADRRTDASGESGTARWQPLNARQRRVLGVLVEKAKTTPDGYPMTLNSLTAGCNQKSNRDPQMNLSPEDVEEVLEGLRAMGAVTEVQSSGRVAKFRHQMYEWLGVDKVELAVMAELLLRGEQTIGELRARASRMESIPGLAELKPILQSLMEKRLVISLTPEGRGQLVTHGLYREKELEQLKGTHGRAAFETGRDAANNADAAEVEPSAAASGLTANWSYASRREFDELRGAVEELREEVARLQERLNKLDGSLG